MYQKWSSGKVRKEDIEEFLEEYVIPYSDYYVDEYNRVKCSIGDFSVDSKGLVNVGHSITINNFKDNRLPIRFGKVEGRFYVINVKLDDMYGFPESCEELRLERSDISSYDYCPIDLKGFLYYGPNLDGIDFSKLPKKLDMILLNYYNNGNPKLSSDIIESLPKTKKLCLHHFEISKCKDAISKLHLESIDLRRCSGFSNFEGLIPTGIKNIIVEYNKDLTDLVGLPSKIDGDLSIYYCGIETLVGCCEEIGGDFCCSENGLLLDNPEYSFQGCPKKVGGNFECEDSLDEDNIFKDADDDGYEYYEYAGREFYSWESLEDYFEESKDKDNIRAYITNVCKIGGKLELY